MFGEEAPVLQLPMDYARPPMQRFEGEHLTEEWDAERTEKLKAMCAEQGATLYMGLVAAYQVLLANYAGQEDIVMGTPVAGRRHADVEQVIGMFVNTLALRNRPSGKKRYDEYLTEVKQMVLDAMEHQDYPFEELVEKAPVLHGFNATEAGYPKERTIHVLFEEQAARTPEAEAVVFGSRNFT